VIVLQDICIYAAFSFANVGNNCDGEVQSNGGLQRKTIHATTLLKVARAS
jgi:hypothetical protein